MGGVFSKKVGDRSGAEYGANPFSTQEQQTMPYVEDRYEREHTETEIPKAAVVGETTTTNASPGGWGVTTTSTTTNANTGGWGAGVTSTTTNTGQFTSGQGEGGSAGQTAGWGTGETIEIAEHNAQVRYMIGFVAFVLVFGVGGYVLFTQIDYGTGSSFGSPSFPTPSPTVSPTFVNNCPAVFSGGKMETITGCESFFCNSGTVRWCGLNDVSSYRLLVSVRGDLDGFGETITINSGAFSEVAGGDGSIAFCDSSFVSVFDQTLSPSAGVILMDYTLSSSVSLVCDANTVSARLNVTLVEL